MLIRIQSLPLLLALVACDTASITGSSKKSATAAAAKKTTPVEGVAPDPTVVTGRLIVATDAGAIAAAAEATVYLEGLPDTKYPTGAAGVAQAGVFNIEVPEAAFTKEGTGLVDSSLMDERKIAWYAVHQFNGKTYGVEQPNVVVKRNEITDLRDVLLTPTGSIKGNVSKNGASQQDGIVVQIPGTIFKTITNAYGDFVLSGVPEASWALEFSAAGYDAKKLPPVKVLGDDKLEVGQHSLTKTP